MHTYRAEAYLHRFSLTVISEQALLEDELLDRALHSLDAKFDIKLWQGKTVGSFLKCYCPYPFVERVTPLV